MSTQPEGELRDREQDELRKMLIWPSQFTSMTIEAWQNWATRVIEKVYVDQHNAIETHTNQRVEEAVRKIIETFRIESSFLVEETFELKHRLREPESSEYNLGVDTMRATLDEGFDRLANDLLATLNNSKKETE